MDARLHMTAEEKGFNYRQKFMTEITIYLVTLIGSCFMALNHMMSVNRKRRHYSEEYANLMKAQKNPQDKKNDWHANK